MNRILLLLTVLVVCSCQTNEEKTIREYLFLGHPYDWNYPDRIDARLEKVDFSAFDELWLGGDVCSGLTQKQETFDYLDTVLNIDRKKLQWAWGNHDIRDGHPEYVSNFTGHNSFYTTTIEDICVLVLNTNLFFVYDGMPPQSNCIEKQKQQNFVANVLDTIKESSHLVVLHHNALFSSLVRDKEDKLINTFNFNSHHLRMTCDSSSYVTQWLLPKVEEVVKKGVEVVFVGGDFGMQAKQFEYQLKPGITLLGSGINNSIDTLTNGAPDYVTNYDKDQVLIFEHNTATKELTWQFVLLEEMLMRYPDKTH